MRPIITALLIFLLGGCSQDGKKCQSAAECDDLNPCTDDACLPDTGCVNENNTAVCDDGDACTLLDLCSGGECRPGVPLKCDDGNPCTDDGCDPASGCSHVDNTAPCDDLDDCTRNDSCLDGVCTPGEPVVCDDQNECTDDSCDSSTGECVFADNSNSCDDGVPCTYNDKCSNAACTGRAYTCDDRDQCTVDICNGDGSCSHEDNTAPCDDGNLCTGPDACQDGVCTGPYNTAPCDDGNLCTGPDACQDGVCTGPNNTVPCDDHNPCTDPDACQDGICTGPMICSTEVVVLVYLDGDNDLDPYAMDDLQEMQAADVDDAGWLRVFVLLDRSPYAGWTDTRLFEIHNGSRTELDGPALGITAGASQDELNMGDPATLSAFIDDGMALGGPGLQYFLILWDHGDGWRRRSTGYEDRRSFKQVCGDDTSDDWLQTRELHAALAGKGLTLVGFDACLEGMVEVAYEIRTDAMIMVASEETEPAEGWSYTDLLQQFMTTGDHSPVHFGQTVVDTFLDSAGYGDVTLSVLDLARAEDLAAGCDAAAAALTGLSAGDWDNLCRNLDFFGGWWPEPHADLVQLFETARSIDGANSAVYDGARALVEDMVLYDRRGDRMPFAHGLAVYFECESSVDPDYDAATIQWAADTGWDEMLRSH